MSNAVSDVTNAVSDAVNTVVNDVSNVVTTIVNNPIPIIETVAVTLAFGPEGLDLASTIGAPATAAVSSAAVAAANGENVDQIAQAAAGAAAGNYVSTNVATSIGGTTPPSPPSPDTPPTPPTPPAPGEPPTPEPTPAPPTPPTPPTALTTTLANIAGSAAGSAAQTAIMGGNAATILQNAAAGAAAAGVAGGASALGAGTTLSNVLGGAVGGASQAGGNTLAALTGAAGGAARSVSPTGEPTTTASTTPVVDISQGTQVAGPGGLPSNGFQPGTITQTAAGLFTTYIASDGTVISVPITVNSTTGEVSTTSNDPAAINAVKVLSADPSQINPIYYDKTPIDPNLTPEETSALAQVSSAFQNIAKNIDLTALTNSAYSENATAALSSPVLQNLLQQAQNQSFANEITGILQNIANPDNAFNGVATYNRQLLQEVVNAYPQFNTQEIQNVITPPLIPLTQGTVNSLNVPNVDVTNIPLPPGVPTDAVLSINPVDNSLVFYSPSTTQTYNEKGQTENPVSPGSQTTTPTETFPTVSSAPGTTTGTTSLSSTGAATGTTTGATTKPNITTSPTTPTQYIPPTTTTVEPNEPSFPTVSAAIPSTPKTPTAPTITTPNIPTAPTTQITDVTTPQAPAGPSTEKTPFPTYTPDVFVYGNVPRGLRGGPFASITSAAPGESVGLGGGGGGVNVESGKEQAPVWNVSSLKLKPGEEGEDYSNLSSALGI